MKIIDHRSAAKRVDSLENNQNQWTTLQFLEPIKGFTGENAILYKITHVDELSLADRQWYEEESDPLERYRILIRLMVNCIDIRVRHKLMEETIAFIPVVQDALRDLLALVSERDLKDIEKTMRINEKVHTDYINGNLDIRACLAVIENNRERWLNECSGANN